MTLTSSIDKSEYLRRKSLEMQQIQSKLNIFHDANGNKSTQKMPQFSKMPRQVRTLNYLRVATKNVFQVSIIALFSSMLISNLVGQQLTRDQIGPGLNLG